MAVFGGYVNATEVISAAAQTQILAKIDQFIALIPDPSKKSDLQAPTPHSDFDLVHPQTARQYRIELAALKAAIDAAPTA